MEIRIEPLTEENLGDAPEWPGHPASCKYCLYWEHPELFARSEKEDKVKTFEKKRAWLRRTRGEFGECGRLLYVGGKAVGYAQYAPASFLPNAADYRAGPVSADAVLLACLFIPGKEHRGQGLGSLLLGHILGELHSRGMGAVETFARWGGPENPSGPVEFYLKHGFSLHRDDPEFPLLRRELTPGSPRGSG